MNFEEINKVEYENDVQLPSGLIDNTWQKISEFILKQKPEFLRKSLRCLNKERYDHLDKMSKSMVRLKPRRSRCQNQSFYKLQSIRQNKLSPQQRRTGFIAINSNAKSYLQVPGRDSMKSSFVPDEEIDEENITRIVSMMKFIKTPSSRPDSPQSEKSSTSTNSGGKPKLETFDKYLLKLREQLNKKVSVEKSPTKSPLFSHLDKKMPTFEPLGKSFKNIPLTPRQRPCLRVFSESKFEGINRNMFKSEKNVMKSSPLLKPSVVTEQRKANIINSGQKILESKLSYAQSSKNILSTTRVRHHPSTTTDLPIIDKAEIGSARPLEIMLIPTKKLTESP